MHLIRGLNVARKESGQVLIMYAFFLPVLLLFVGLGIDFGFGLLTKNRLAKAADAASLAVMLNLGQGDSQARAIGQSVFALNINTGSKLYVSPPIPNININHSGTEPVVDVSATATIRTFFIGLAGFHTLNVGGHSQATRPPVILSLVLDKSGSMKLNGGSTALPPSVTTFLGYFIEGTDQLGEVSFSTIATPDVAISKTFHTPINNFVNGMPFGGATFAQGGLLDAQGQVTGVSSPPPNAVQVVVFFTDGWANTVSDTLGGSLVNFGGCAPAEFDVGWCGAISCMNPTTGSQISSTAVSSTTTAAKCNGVGTFTAQDTVDLTNPASLTIQNIATEADYRAIQLANTMRTQGITVYSIGLGDKINTTYLQELANDPASPVYNPNEPSGLAEFAPTSSDLNTAFQTVAAKILLRLTQ